MHTLSEHIANLNTAFWTYNMISEEEYNREMRALLSQEGE